MDPKSIFDCIDFKTMLWPSYSTVLMIYSHFVPKTGPGRVPKRIQNPSPIHPAFLFRAVQLFSICFRVAQWIQKPSSIASILASRSFLVACSSSIRVVSTTTEDTVCSWQVGFLLLHHLQSLSVEDIFAVHPGQLQSASTIILSGDLTPWHASATKALTPL